MANVMFVQLDTDRQCQIGREKAAAGDDCGGKMSSC